MLTQDYIKVVSNLLAGNSSFTPNYLYVEFTNSSNPSIPSDNQGRAYYEELSEPLGYLRVPITIKPTVTGDNQITYTVLLTSTASMNDVAFGDGSTIYGVALVSALDPDDPLKDIVFAREYFDSPSKQLAMVDGQTFCFSFQLAVFESGDPEPEEMVWHND